MDYCSFIRSLPPGEKKTLHEKYHNLHYGFPLHDDNELFGRLIMEINQAGLSWETILKKEAALRRAYDHFDIKTIAAYTETDRVRLLNDPGIIRNRRKIDAVIQNAQTILLLQKEYGSFEKWLRHHHPKTVEEWVALFKQTFRFTGGEIVNEFLMSIGYLPGAHSESCPVYDQIMRSKPMWKNHKDD
ncbi:DNA-3-methyladenine glycosylase I [Limibacterium fermenti]|uniref:DNA-3-methyladenine glycosylase I n=1 Tax=Limibacterium fermenti TaxID=3229863 RepID=UPI000E9CA5CB|nr:DNA-3-methyladenine glycosylase [Porphyromonadaceae bacterium]HBX45076.1 DNA-3-methyladenine glycosylase [Porphyromonadaceae bacterium]